jgi:hypothetical protein
MKRRIFKVGDREIPAYETVRKKSRSNEIIKMLRKGTEDPNVAIQDKLGLLAVFNNNKDLDSFYGLIADKGYEAGYIPEFEQIVDTLHGEKYHGNNNGSSDGVRMRKLFIKMGGIRIEIILQTNDGYLDSRFKKEDAHQEYEIRRLHKDGVIDLLFPKPFFDIYPGLYSEALHAKRKLLEDPARLG